MKKMSRSRNTYKSKNRRPSGKTYKKPSYKKSYKKPSYKSKSNESRHSGSRRKPTSRYTKPQGTKREPQPVRESLKPKVASIPGTIKYQGYTYKYGGFSASDLETVVRESKKYTEKGMDVHIKEINGRLHLFYRKVPKDMPLIEDPNHPAARGVYNDDTNRDESEPTRKDWINNKIPPYWLKGTSRAQYIKASSPNAPLYTEEDFSFDPETGKLKSLYGWKSLSDFPRISDIDPDTLKQWIKGSLSTAGAFRSTRIKNELEDDDEISDEIDDETLEELIEETINEDEEEHDLDEEDEELTPNTPPKIPTRSLSGEHDIRGSIKSAAGSAGRLVKSAASAGARSLKNYAEWVEEKNLEAAERGEHPPRGRPSSSKGRKYSNNLMDEEEYDIEDDIRRRDEHYNKVMNRLGFGAAPSEEPPDLSPEEIRRRDQQFQARATTLLMGGRPSRPPMTEEERIKEQQRYDANAQFLIGGGSSRRQQQSPNPQATEEHFQNALNTLMYGTLPQSRPNTPQAGPPRKQTPSNTSQVNRDINLAKQNQERQQRQKAAEERRRAEQERLDRTMNEFMGISAPRRPTPAKTQGKGKPAQKPAPSNNPIQDFLYGNLL